MIKKIKNEQPITAAHYCISIYYRVKLKEIA